MATQLEAQAPTETPAAPASKQTPAVEDHASPTSPFEEISDADINAMVAQALPVSDNPVIEAPKVEPETPVVPTPEPPAGEQSPVAPVEDPDVKISDRIRIAGTDTDKALVNAANILVRTQGISFVEAMKRIAPETVVVPETPQVNAVNQQLTDLETRQGEIEAKLTELGATEGLYTPEIASLNIELSKVNARLEVTKDRVQQNQVNQEQQTVAQFETQRNTVLSKSVDVYPQMADKTSAQWQRAKAINDEILADPNHPDRAVLETMNAPRFLADMAFNQLQDEGVDVPRNSGKKPTPAPLSVPQQPQTSPPPVAPGSRQTAPPTPAKTPAQEIEEVQAAATNLFDSDSIQFRPRASSSSRVR